MKLILVISAILALCAADAPLSGPYPAAGFRPKGPQFLLPGEVDEQNKQAEETESNVEINKERVDFAGSTLETEQTPEEPIVGYLPPVNAVANDEQADTVFNDEQANTVINDEQADTVINDEQADTVINDQQADTVTNDEEIPDDRRVQGLPQGLPAEEEVSPFAETETANKPSQEYGPPKDNTLSRFQLPPQQRNVNFNRQQQFGRLVQQPSAFQRFQPRQQFQFARQEIATPAPKYGVPKAEEVPVDDDIEVNDEASAPAVEAAKSGRYYVLSPDNTLQRVRYQTFQSADDRRSNGFSAKLKYMPVEPIRDPVYAYNEQGVLVRIYRK